MATQTMVRSAPPTGLRFYAWVGILGLLALQGLYSFVVLTTEGFYVTNLTDQVPWGLSLSGYVFFIGASAGATVIGLLIHVFDRKDYAQLGTRAILVALLSLAAAVLFIATSVGSIARSLLLPWFWNNPTSIFTYTSTTYYVLGALLLVQLYFTLKVNRRTASASEAQLARWLAIGTGIFAIVVIPTLSGALFAVVKARDFWNNPALAPHFAVVAVVTGLAMMMLVPIVAAATRRELVSQNTLSHMGLLLAFFVVVAGFFDFFDLLVFTYSDKLAGNEAWHFLSSAHLPLSAVHVVGYVVGFGILVSGLRRSTPWLAVAAIAIILAVASYRYNLTTVGVSMPLYPFIEHEHYVPSLIEFSVAIGIVALVLLLYSIAIKVVPLEGEAIAPKS